MAASNSPQSQAIQAANEFVDIAQRVMDIYHQLKDLNAAVVDNKVAQTLGTMQTVPYTGDGALSDTPDGGPNTANPINPAKYPTMNRAVSMTQLVQVKTILDGLIEYVEGKPVQTQVGARAILNAVIGG